LIIRIVLGFALSIAAALIARSLKVLNASGAVAAALIGGVIFSCGGFDWAVLLLVFFISSSFLSRLTSKRKLEAGEKFSKDSARDWGQVLANGGLGAILAVFYAYLSGKTGSTQPDISGYSLWVAYAGSLAAVAADTWATELGLFSQSRPMLITTGKPVSRGTSGAVSLAGSIAAGSGAAAIGIFACILFPPVSSINTASLGVILSVSIGGLCASFFDSFLGATIQAMFYCPTCEKETERFPLHTCNSQTLKIRGLYWMNNDWVNFIASFFGMCLSSVLWFVYRTYIA